MVKVKTMDFVDADWIHRSDDEEETDPFRWMSRWHQCIREQDSALGVYLLRKQALTLLQMDGNTVEIDKATSAVDRAASELTRAILRLDKLHW